MKKIKIIGILDIIAIILTIHANNVVVSVADHKTLGVIMFTLVILGAFDIWAYFNYPNSK